MKGRLIEHTGAPLEGAELRLAAARSHLRARHSESGGINEYALSSLSDPFRPNPGYPESTSDANGKFELRAFSGGNEEAWEHLWMASEGGEIDLGAVHAARAKDGVVELGAIELPKTQPRRIRLLRADRTPVVGAEVVWLWPDGRLRSFGTTDESGSYAWSSRQEPNSIMIRIQGVVHVLPLRHARDGVMTLPTLEFRGYRCDSSWDEAWLQPRLIWLIETQDGGSVFGSARPERSQSIVSIPRIHAPEERLSVSWWWFEGGARIERELSVDHDVGVIRIPDPRTEPLLVVDQEGEAVKDAKPGYIFDWSEGGLSAPAYTQGFPPFENLGDGRYRMHGLSSHTVCMTAEAPGFTRTAGEERIELKRKRRREVRVLTAESQQPIAGVPVKLRCYGDLESCYMGQCSTGVGYGVRKTDEAGSARFEDCHHPGTMSARVAGRWVNQEFQVDDQGVVVTVPATGTIVGRVLAPEHWDLANGIVVAKAGKGSFDFRPCKSKVSADGEFRIKNVPPGNARIDFHRNPEPDYPNGRFARSGQIRGSVDVESGGQAFLMLDHSKPLGVAGGWIRIAFFDGDAPVESNFYLNFGQDEIDLAEFTTGPDGRTEIPVPPGVFQVFPPELEKLDVPWSRRHTEFSIDAGTTLELAFQLEPTLLRMRALDRNGEPLAHTTLTLLQREAPTDSVSFGYLTKTDAAGWASMRLPHEIGELSFTIARTIDSQVHEERVEVPISLESGKPNRVEVRLP